MNRDQAVAIVQQLRDAQRSLEGAARSAVEQDQALQDGIRDLYITLSFDLLPQIYDQHPDLRPPPEKPTISSRLSWDKVRLPPEISEKDIDEALFLLLNRHWQKVAMVLAHAGEHFEPRGLSLEIIAARLRYLADNDQIEGAGDLRKWRHSEVRLKKISRRSIS